MLVLFVISMLLSSCARLFPAEWGGVKQPPATGCADISGTFRNVGERGSGGEAKLGNILDYFGNSEAEMNNASHFTIEQQAPEKLSITAWRHHIEIINFQLQEGEDFTCSPDGIIMPPPVREVVAGDAPVAAILNVTHYFLKTEEGFLVVKTNERGLACCIIVPAPWREVSWDRFQPVAN